MELILLFSFTSYGLVIKQEGLLMLLNPLLREHFSLKNEECEQTKCNRTL